MKDERNLIVYLLRHAPAEERDPTRWPDDAHRPLSRKGRHRCDRIAKTLGRLGLGVDVVLSSPFERARQTAQVVARQLGTELRYEDALKPDGEFEAIIDLLRDLGAGAVMLVGHEPALGELAGRVLCGTPADFISLKKAGILRLHVHRFDARGACARLDWMLAPSLLACLEQ